MMSRYLLTTFLASVQGSKDDNCVLQAGGSLSDDESTMLQDEDSCVLQHLRRTVGAELHEVEDASGNSYCDAIFHHDTNSAQVCKNCITTVKSANSIPTDRLMHKSPWFAKEVADCLVNEVANPTDSTLGAPTLPTQLQTRLDTCGAMFGAGNCTQAIAHCLAVHADEALASVGTSATPAQQLSAMGSHEGFLSCMAHHLDHELCLGSPMGAGNCMAAGISCIDAGMAPGAVGTAAHANFIGCWAGKRAEYFAANPAQKEVYDMCEYHYGQGNLTDAVKKVALAKCGGCAMAAKMEFGTNHGHRCVREHCLRIPALVQGVTQCMMNTQVPCEALNSAFVPAPFSGAVDTCTTVFGTGRAAECLQKGAQCLGLHPCADSATCANDDGWFACFAKKMGAGVLCEKHPSGMAKCLKCGVHLIKTNVCESPMICATEYAGGNTTVKDAHNLCVAHR